MNEDRYRELFKEERKGIRAAPNVDLMKELLMAEFMKSKKEIARVTERAQALCAGVIHFIGEDDHG